MVEWTVGKVFLVMGLFVLAGVAEIGGGWLVWKAVRGGSPWWWAILGSLALVCYGFIPTLQPLDDFGRLYAVYGGVFIGLSFAWAALLDGFTPDIGDGIGSIVAIIGVFIILFWPRDPSGSNSTDSASNSVAAPS
mmetsp:Transcript_18554/g.25806  ORF Transcript_18554/g.25806 Transcript_18554/m.25806 type:complete len:135 (-) Transcript_18554:128-532(-)|eukprot:CAMPEP_0184501948 /NCGR_PEP_ID=MMETSP0113_2-20130426/49020_1 /TAXON_ID=91329 /ORGANISM="Norrisiella sphaerica, Strain BC52" /LENGTH=134 /DNA_ID=CAMNT_0026890899 /DNA_START=178 /DNA_END=582 /DNA_ORIENTATION=-